MKHVIGHIKEFPSGSVRLIEVEGRSVGVFNIDGSLYGLLNFCPHRGAPVCKGERGGTMLPGRPGRYQYGFDGKILRCPWHGIEFHIETGRPVFDMYRGRIVTFPVELDSGHVVLVTRTRSVSEAPPHADVTLGASGES